MLSLSVEVESAKVNTKLWGTFSSFLARVEIEIILCSVQILIELIRFVPRVCVYFAAVVVFCRNSKGIYTVWAKFCNPPSRLFV